MQGPEAPAQSKYFAEAAFAAMLAHDIPPTPQNYTVWFSYASGTMPELNRSIDILISNHQPFTPVLNAELFQRHFVADDEASLLQNTGGRLKSLVEEVRDAFNTAAGDVDTFGQTLDDFSSAVGYSDTGDKVRRLVADLIQETQLMSARNAVLESRLGKASGEVFALRETLVAAQREALTDALTNIPNRKFFDTRLREAARDSMENGEPLSLLIADIDHFKRFNDSYGHQTGDQVLRLVARMLTESVKGRDTSARYGGEEFAIVLPQTRLRDAVVVADQIRTLIMRRKLVGKESRESYGFVTLSFGVSEYRPGEKLSEMIERADGALYDAKRNGRNRVSTEALVPVEAPVE